MELLKLLIDYVTNKITSILASLWGTHKKMLVDTKVPQEVHDFTWRIANFTEMLGCPEMLELARTDIEMGQAIGFPVKLRAYLSSYENEKDYNNKWVGVDFTALNSKTDVMMMAEMQIGNDKKVKFDTIKNVAGQSWGWSMFPEEETLSNIPLNSDGSLTIDIKLTLFKMPGTASDISSLMAKYKQRFFQSFSQDMENFYKGLDASSSEPSNINVLSREGKEFAANSAILAARSPVFQSMFQTPMKEVKEGVVNIDDIGSEALDVFLHFMHTGNLRDDWKNSGILEDLTYAAHRYLMQDLLDFLDEGIGLVFTAENCAKLIRLAHKLGLKKAEKVLQPSFIEQMKVAGDYEKMIELLQN